MILSITSLSAGNHSTLSSSSRDSQRAASCSFKVSEPLSTWHQYDIIIPNLTEACMLTGIEYRTQYDEDYIRKVVDGLLSIIGDQKTVVITGVGFRKGETGVGVYSKDRSFHYPHVKLEKNVSGTGDIFASAFTGALMNGISTDESAKIAADFTLAAIKETIENSVHWYGVKFETVLGRYMQRVVEG